jgi:MoxR-like ATPase
MNDQPAAYDIHDLGRRRQRGEKLNALALEAGVPASTLSWHLAKAGYYGAQQAGPVDIDEVARKVKEMLPEAAGIDADLIRAICREEIAQLQPAVPCFQVQWPDDSTVKVEGKAHAKFARVLKLAAARRNVLLVGPAGTGKTHLAQQVAEALGLDFAFISCSAGMSEGQLMGRLVPTGEGGRFEYLRSEFVRCYEEGGVFLFDEMDAADSNTMIVINSALANGHMAVPNRPESPVARKHPDFVCIAAANTFGTGADRQYVGRNQMDEATLDRFRIGQVEVDYDAEVEAALCPDDKLRGRLQGYRERARSARLRRVVSMRFLRDAHVMKQAGFTDADIDEALFAGWSRDEIAKVR